MVMLKRSIIIFPKFTNIKKIEELRCKYDPLYGLIKPHITIVFPFESDITKEDLENHIKKSLEGVGSFKVLLQGITGTSDGYLFLNVKKGNDEIIKIHDRLYDGTLRKFLYRKCSYIPHLTVGQIEDELSFEKALKDTEEYSDVFEANIEKIYVEIIDENEKSIIEQVITLG